MRGPTTSLKSAPDPEQLTPQDYELSEEELTQVDEAILQADNLMAAGIPLTTAADFFTRLERKHRLAS